MNNKQALVYGVLESTNDHDQPQKQEIRFLLIIFIDENHFKKGKHGTT